MSPVSSAIGMNSAGDTRPCSGCGQRSSASTPPMRPVGQVDRAAGSAAMNSPRSSARRRSVSMRQAAAHALGHLRAEELAVVAARLLRVVHRGVGVAHQRLGVSPSRGIQRDADAAVGMQLVPRDRERLGELGQDASGHACRLRAVVGDVGHADDELVAAQARHGVLVAQAAREPRGDRRAAADRRSRGRASR